MSRGRTLLVLAISTSLLTTLYNYFLLDNKSNSNTILIRNHGLSSNSQLDTPDMYPLAFDPAYSDEYFPLPILTGNSFEPELPNVTYACRCKSESKNCSSLLLYKAFNYEEPIRHGLKREILILSLAQVSFHDRFQLRPVCVLWNSSTDNDALTVGAKVIHISSKNGLILKERTYNLLGIRCLIPTEMSGRHFDFVSAYFNGHLREPVSSLASWLVGYVPVTYVEETGEEHQQFMGLCGSTWYALQNQSSTDPYRLLEWFEYHIMIGVNHFHLTLPPPHLEALHLSAEAMQVLNYYRSIGLADWKHGPAFNMQTSHLWSLVQPLQPLVLNECFLTNRKKYKYITVIDSDEALVLKSNNSDNSKSILERMVEEAAGMIPPGHNLSSITLDSFQYTTNCDRLLSPNSSLLQNYLISNSSRYYLSKFNKGAEQKTFGKSIISTSNCESISAHLCAAALYGSLNVHLDSKMGRVQHYREAKIERANNSDSIQKAQLRCQELLSQKGDLENLITSYIPKLKQRIASKQDKILSRR